MAIGASRTSTKPFEGVIAQLENLYATTKSEFTRKRLRAYQGRRVCRVCHGARLKPEILAVTLRTQDGREFGIQEMCGLSIAEAATAMEELQVAPGDVEIVKDVLREVRQRLRFLNEVGLGYLQLSRESGTLSGGERNRVHLAKVLKEGGNLLLLDEPTNDLDVDTLRALEDALLEFAGSIMVISHDRWFLDRIATHILAAEGDSKWVFFDGNYQEYEADKKKRLGEEGARPKRVRFKALK